MDALFERFLTKIGITNLNEFETGSFAVLENDKDHNTLIAKIKLDHYLNYKTYIELFDKASDYALNKGFTLNLSFIYLNEESHSQSLLDEYIEENKIIGMDDYSFLADDNELKLLFYYEITDDVVDLNNQCRKLKDFLDSISSSYKILIQEKVYFDDNFSEERDESYLEKSKEMNKKFQYEKQIQTNYQPCKLKDIENFRMVIVEGTIFKLQEPRTTKKNMLLQTIEYSDGSDSISSTLFESKRMTRDEISKYKVGTRIKVKGKPIHDQYSHNELVISIDSIEILDPLPKRMDTYERKRVELHAHTKMSAFDAVCSVTDYLKTAARWGHKAFAITDHGNVQAYPEAQKASKSTGVKVLYGTELYVVQDTPTYVFNPSDLSLKGRGYVIFDTETTGLSCRYDRLIEFGAVKIDQTGQVVDEIDFFINPDGHKLSKFSIEHSHITQNDVDHGKPIKQALKDILEFFGDDIIVAHNASFDFDFINEALLSNGMETIKNPVIDTLPLSRYMYPDMHRHNEEALARRLGVEFDSVTAHRANYDAEHLAKIFSVMLTNLLTTNPNIKHKDLENLPISKDVLLGLHPYHVTAYVKNPDGLKDLYKIISLSNTTYLNKNSTPITPLSVLESYRKNLIIGSACLNGDVWETAITKGEGKLKEKIKFFDFIEVQPPANYLYQINTGNLSDFDEVKKILSDLILLCKKEGKMVCATSDCHYLEPEDKIYRDIYISAKGLKGVRHPLNLAPRENAAESVKQAWYKHPLENPDQHLRTTDEMIKEFDFLNDLKLQEEIVIDNTNKIADMVEDGISPTKSKLYAPYIEGADDKLTELTYKTAKELYGDPLPQVIADRLDIELKGIITNGYGVIYWLSSYIVRWSNSCGYMIGSRGSVGSSLVATMSGITEVNPLPPHHRCPHCKHIEWADISKYDSGFDLPPMKCPVCGEDMIGDGQNIPFATFLGFHAEKVPDIDLNFPSDFQARAHLQMQKLLNESGNHCYKAGTIQTAQEKQARGYVLGYFESLGIDTSNIRNAEIDRLASQCVDVKRSTGQHPGGVIVIPKGMDATDFTPTQFPADNTDSDWETTHYDFHAIHDNVLKFDMLGHVDPMAVKMQCDLCDFSFTDMQKKIPISDLEALSLFWSADALHLKDNILQQQTGALGLPEFGTENGRRVLIETQPHSFSDLVRISGLSHGTNVFAGNAEDLIVKEGFKLGDVIACRDDIMTVLHDKYGVENGDAFKIMEFTRKGMFGKSGNDDVKEKYNEILKAHNVPEWYIESCHKIAYMFPKGHAVAYVTNCIRCAWFKVHEPLAYYATYFTLRCDAYDIKTMMKGINACLKKRNDILERLARREKVTATESNTINAYESTIEMYDRGYKFEQLDVTKADATKFTVNKETKSVIPSLICVDNLGESLANQIIEARNKAPFTSIRDLKKRGGVGDKMIDVLRDLHALDSLPEDEQITLF